MRRFVLLYALCFWIGFPLSRGAAQGIPTQIVPSELEGLQGSKEVMQGNFAGLIYFPQSSPQVQDEEYLQPFAVTGGVYMAERAEGKVTRYSCRFLVHAPDRETMAFTKRVAQTLLLLHGIYQARFRADHPPPDKIAEVWLTNRVGGVAENAAGRQFKNQIYLFHIFLDRPPNEWLREIAHEYGHYVLPGISGFTAPEAWGNGVLGERLFLKWIREEVEANRIQLSELPFVTPELLQAHCEKYVEPLQRKIAQNGLQPALLAKKNEVGMDYFTALALYVDSIYGSRGLREAFSYTESSQNSQFMQAPDFWKGVQLALKALPDFNVYAPQGGSGLVFLPQGSYLVEKSSSVKTWRIESKSSPVKTQGNLITLTHSAWVNLTLQPLPSAKGATFLHLRRRGA